MDEVLRPRLSPGFPAGEGPARPDLNDPVCISRYQDQAQKLRVNRPRVLGTRNLFQKAQERSVEAMRF
jgi:hypothetical protein